MNNDPNVERTKIMAADLGLKAEFIGHEQSGKTTAEAVEALGIPATNILKTLVLYSSERREFVGAIILGTDRLDIKKVAALAAAKKLRFADAEQIRTLTGYQIGGVPPFAVRTCAKAFIDTKVLQKEAVVGAGGSEHCGMRFSPRDLVRAITIDCAPISA